MITSVISATCRMRRACHFHSWQSEDAAGLDLVAAVAAEKEVVLLMPGERALIPTGLAIELPEGFEAQVRPRSGLALKYGVTVLNSPGTIDADYRGEIGVILVNLGQRPFSVRRGARIAQLVIRACGARRWSSRRANAHKSARGAEGIWVHRAVEGGRMQRQMK